MFSARRRAARGREIGVPGQPNSGLVVLLLCYITESIFYNSSDGSLVSIPTEKSQYNMPAVSAFAVALRRVCCYVVRARNGSMT